MDTHDEPRLAHLGKLGEEAGELSSIVSRCIIQGINEADPESGKSNREALAEEIADVFAMAELVIERFSLHRTHIADRMTRKIAMKRAWHARAQGSKNESRRQQAKRLCLRTGVL